MSTNPWPLPIFDHPAVRYDRGWRWPTAEEIAFYQTHPNQGPSKTMTRQHYYPSRITDQVPWLGNFATELPKYEPTFAPILPARFDAAVADALFCKYVLSEWLTGVRAFGPECTRAVDLVLEGTGAELVVLPTFTAPALPLGVAPVPPGALTRIFDFIGELKEHNAFTDVIGADLQVLPPAGTPPPGGGGAPEIKGKVEQGDAGQRARLTFVKHGHMGVYLECRRGPNGEWQFLAIDTDSPYLDERPLLTPGQPEVREYRARFWDKGTPNGEWSPVVRLTIAP